MATSLPVDPTTYVHPASLTFRNIQYAPHLQLRLNVYKAGTGVTGGNPWMIYFHGGGWGSNDKTTTQESSAQKQKLLWAYLLDTASYGTAGPAFTLISAEWRMHAHSNYAPGPLNTPYETTIEGTNPGTGPTSYPSYFPTFIRDAKRAIQFVKQNATRFGLHPDKGVSWGTSAGAANALVAALTPSAPFVPDWLASSRWDVHHDDTVRGVLNWYGEIDFDPWYMHYSILAPAFGLVESNTTQAKADFERLMLIPDSSGLYPQGSPVTPLCKSISARYLLRAGRSANTSIKIRSHYDKAEETTVPQTGYSTIPPYLATGHDWRQFADIEAECADAGVEHSGSVVDASLHGGSTQIAWEGTLAGTKSWLDGLVNF